MMSGQEDILRAACGDADMQMNLAGRHQLGNLQEESLAAVQHLGAFDGDDVMTWAFRILHGILGRSIRWAEEVVPALSKMGRGLAGDGRIHGAIETQ